MKTLIIYESTHHGNTRKLVDAIQNTYGVDAVSVDQAGSVDFGAYGRIGLASGVAYGHFYSRLEAFAKAHLPAGIPVFFLYTCGKKAGTYIRNISRIAASRNCPVLGSYGCLGFDTFGPFRLVGGLAKGHPTAEEIAGAVDFYGRISQ